MAVLILRSVLDALRAHAARADPHECCGLLLGDGARIAAARPARNVAADPARAFEIDPQALIDQHRAQRHGGPRLLGYYHSHPAGPARPSATDRAQAPRDGLVWAIIAGEAVTLWRDSPGGFDPLPYRVLDG
jgi:proteasome lid subunit RPN8/RPN11